MKYLKRIILLSAVIMIAGCRQEICQEEDFASDSDFLYVNAGLDTKTQMSGATEVFWSPGDEINVFYGALSLGKFSSIAREPSKSTVFCSSLTFAAADLDGTSDYVGIYPYSAVDLKMGDNAGPSGFPIHVGSVQTACEGSFDRGSFPSAGVSEDLTLSFYNVCGGVKFKVRTEGVTSVVFRSNGGEFVSGDILLTTSKGNVPPFDISVSSGVDSVLLECAAGLTVGADYFISLLPVTLSSGYTMEFRTSESKGVRTVSSGRTVKRSIFGDLGVADEGVEYTSELTPIMTVNTVGIYSNCSSSPVAILSYNEDEDQLTCGFSSMERSFGVMNFGQLQYWGKVAVSPSDIVPGGIYSAASQIGDDMDSYKELKCVRLKGGLAWLENQATGIGIIIPVE